MEFSTVKSVVENFGGKPFKLVLRDLSMHTTRYFGTDFQNRLRALSWTSESDGDLKVIDVCTPECSSINEQLFHGKEDVIAVLAIPGGEEDDVL